MRRLLLALLFIYFSAGLVYAQLQYGDIRGLVADENGEPLPGAALTLESKLFAPRISISSAGGVFRFISVTPGVYTLRCDLAGFKNHLQENVNVRVGSSFDFPISLAPVTLESEITVIAESPVVDTKKTGTTYNLTLAQLQDIPSARDPYVILQQIPGIQVGSENVGGAGAGSRSVLVSKGAMAEDETWNIDGVPVTDLANIGANNPWFYDFDVFEEVQIVTGGGPATVQTPGISVNLITRRGGNAFRGTARFFFTNDDLQSDNRTQELLDLNYIGDRIRQITDYGLQFGGPIKKDRLWFWLGYGVQDVRNLTIDGYPKDMKIRSFNAKLNAQLSRNNRAEFALMIPRKEGKGIGASSSRPPETTVDFVSPGNFYLKLEDEHTFNDNMLLSLKLSYSQAWDKDVPHGGLDTQVGYDMATGMYSGSFWSRETRRPSISAQLDGNYYRERFLGGSHELKFGLEFRSYTEYWDYRTPGNALKLYWDGMPLLAELNREDKLISRADRWSAYVNDSYTRGRLTLNLGLRVDRETSYCPGTSAPGNPIVPELLPTLDIPRVDIGLVWWTFSPRIGFTYDLTGDHKTVLRASGAAYGGQMITFMLSALVPTGAYVDYYWEDANGDDAVTQDELLGYPYDGLVYYYGFDPMNPTSLDTPNGVDKNVKHPITYELILGLERELFTDFSLGANVILRRKQRDWWTVPWNKAEKKVYMNTDYVGPFTGTVNYGGVDYDYEYWALPEPQTGWYWTTSDWWRRNYTGLEVTAAKRLSHRWMMNASFTIERNRGHFIKDGHYDPTNIKMLEGGLPISWGIGDYLGSEWMGKLSFLYQLPWGFNVSLFVNARQGFVFAERLNVLAPEREAMNMGSNVYLFTVKYGSKKRPDFYNLDISLSKDIRFRDFGRITVSADAFNIFNFAHILNQYAIVNSSRFHQPTMVLNPRVVRLGIRYQF